MVEREQEKFWSPFPTISISQLFPAFAITILQTSAMGKLNIAHHKSYHPYRRDNIEKVRRDEEEARQKEAQEEGRMQLAVCRASRSNNEHSHEYVRTRRRGWIY